jgi:hypothetical protein
MQILTEAQIKDIAQDLEMGMECHWNPENGDIIIMPDQSKYDSFDMDMEAWGDDIKKLKKNKKHYKDIVGMESHESFRVMESFLDIIPDNTMLKVKLIEALNGPKPFRNFKRLIDDSDYREDWFAHKTHCMVELVKEQIEVIIDQKKAKK